MYTSVSRGIDNNVTAGTSGLMLAIMITSVFKKVLAGRLSMPNNAILIVPSGKLTSGTDPGTGRSLAVVRVKVAVISLVVVPGSAC